MGFKGLANRCQNAAFADTVEQGCVDTAFELVDAFAHRRLSDVQLFGRERKGFEFSDGKKGIDLIDLHVISDPVVSVRVFLKGMKNMKIMN